MEQRVIKFRAIVPVNSDGPKSMHYFDLSKIDDCTRLSYADYDAGQLMQYTGLNDKNGKEIYEGDRVMRIKDGVEGVVYWKYDGWFIKVDGSIDARLWDWLCYCESINVIGNIYQPPELLSIKENTQEK